MTKPLTPRTWDGRALVSISPSTEGMNTWFHGAGDLTGSIERGGGQRYLVEFTAEQTGSARECVIRYSEPIEIHDGQCVFAPANNWDVIDYADMYVSLDPTNVIANTSSLGNCNLYPIPGGNLILPAMGDGAYNVDLTKAVPLQSDDYMGYWDADYIEGTITPSTTPGAAKYNLIDFSPPDVYLVMKFPLGQGHGTIDVDVYKTQWVHPSYKVHLSVRKNSPGAGKFAMWVLGFRKYITKY